MPPEKPSEYAPINKRRRCEEVPRDAHGRPVYPIKLGPSLQVYDLGKIIWNRPNFHSEKYIWCVPLYHFNELLYHTNVPSQNVPIVLSFCNSCCTYLIRLCTPSSLGYAIQYHWILALRFIKNPGLRQSFGF